MLAVACTLFAPILATQASLRRRARRRRRWRRSAVGLFVGSFLFGVGMQLGGSCASGTLFAIGSGQTAILLTLGGFIVGATVGRLHFPWWTNELPSHEPVSLADVTGGLPRRLAALAGRHGRRSSALTYVVWRRGRVPAARPAAGRPRRRPGAPRLVAAVGRRAAARRAQRADPLGLRQRLGRHVRVRAVGLEDPRRGRRRRPVVGRSGRTRPTSRSTTPASSPRRPR